MATKRRWILPGAIASILIIFLVLAFIPDPIPVDIHTVQSGSFAVFVEDDGEARVREVYLVSSPLPGRVLRLDGDTGDDVEANTTVLARILPTDPSFLDIRTRTELQAAVEAAQAARALAEAEVKRIEAEVDFAQSEYQRAQKLFERGTVAQAGMDRAERELRTQQAALNSAQASLHIREHELETARAALIDPSDSLDTLDDSHAECCFNVRSPISGQILRLIQESEGVVAAGSPLVEIGNPQDLEIVVDLLSTDAVKVSPGAPVEIHRWGGDGYLNGIVDRIEPYGFTKVSSLGIEEQRVNVIIRLTDPQEKWQRLGHGYRVEVKIFLWQRDNITQVPLSALFRTHTGGKQQWAVFRADGGRAQETVVEAGKFNDTAVQITTGLTPGDTVVLHPSDRVHDGVRVTARTQ